MPVEINEKTSQLDKRVYNLALAYLRQFSELGVTEALIKKYLNYSSIGSRPNTIPEIFYRLLESAQNANMKAGVIGKAVGGVRVLGGVTNNFDPSEILLKYEGKPDILLEDIISKLKPKGSIRKTNRSIWPKYCQTIIASAKFLSQFSSIEKFYQWVDLLESNNLSRPALPLIISREIPGFGFALACDFLKELGYVNFGKPDVHIKDIFKGIGFSPDNATDYEVFKVIIRIATNVGVSPYNVDKLFWLIGSGYFYDDLNIGKNGRVREIDKKEFISLCKNKLNL